ncbi:2-hydroxyacyl-CoA dehydratase family protein [Geodermatophilus ruber]|uniref:Benzoyl-CoA reductase/2-hydroxyglutaryl-CoA dehydratase subunit, BcrC/BadD/HgdB n=1 Tax=Geodermatophilus ruber TaxID=504800 RepID=A0A1I4A9G0_9ACTN|nr:2-hydroxyacyl-CoA dehydratase family protein [Geodermatophilus ruber]SFK53025.1 Benzoyl-CoA reductase/2-hydroxyglutaryl-CoA dehydratase subunit, BcrC/BadD/HgdB [Geodermatophilus ruber]
MDVTTAAAALDRLEQVYSSRPGTVRALAEQGRRVIGVVGADVPVELVEAAGAVAYRLHGHPDVLSAEAQEVLGASLDPVAHSVLTQVLGGSLTFLDGLVVSRDSQASLQLFYALRELRRLEPHRAIPPLHLLDLLHLPTEPTARYDEVRLGRLADVLGSWTGQPVTAGLTASVAAVAELRHLLREVSDLRRGPRPVLTGTRVLRVLGAAAALPTDVSLPLLRRLVDGAGALPALPQGRRVYLTGSAQDHDEVYVALEAALGCLVVGEDTDWGDLALSADVGGADLGALARAYRDRGPAAATASLPRRAAWTAEQVRRSAAEVLLGVVREHDEAPAWDFPAQRAAVAADGVPSALLARQPYRVLATDLRSALGSATCEPVLSGARA